MPRPVSSGRAGDAAHVAAPQGRDGGRAGGRGWASAHHPRCTPPGPGSEPSPPSWTCLSTLRVSGSAPSELALRRAGAPEGARSAEAGAAGAVGEAGRRTGGDAVLDVLLDGGEHGGRGGRELCQRRHGGWRSVKARARQLLARQRPTRGFAPTACGPVLDFILDQLSECRAREHCAKDRLLGCLLDPVRGQRWLYQ